jgi:phospholipid/cholesterol/gamma-HCH transport system permease protein
VAAEYGSFVLIREMCPSNAFLICAGKVSSGIELMGSMKVTEQIDAMEVAAINFQIPS